MKDFCDGLGQALGLFLAVWAFFALIGWLFG